MVVIKHRYIPGRRKASEGGNVVSISKALAHVKYIQHRPGPDKEPGGREMFDERGEDISAKEMRQAIRELGDCRVVVHKLTLAPEINPQDKKAFTREVMSKLGQDMGRDLRWFGVEHNNTEHHHIHVVVLGRDHNGTEVRLGLKDIEKAKEHGERYLERWHPKELERSRKERDGREKERREERVKERELVKDERIRDGLELPWMHKKIVREQLEPYKEWKKKQEQKEREPETPRKDLEAERPYHQDTIEAAGKEWSKANTVKELRGLDEYLWDNYDDRIDRDSYLKLRGWIREKEGRDRGQERQPGEKEARGQDDKKRQEIEHDGKKYRKGDSWEKLSGLSRELRDKSEKLPYDDYCKLRGWIENKDRERWSGALGKQIEATHKKFERSKTMNDLKAQEGGRVLNPLQDEIMRNPIVGLFMTEATIAKEIVRSITLDDRNRDYTKEQRDGLEDQKKALDERERERGFNGGDLSKQQEERDRDEREKLEWAIEMNKRRKEQERKEEQEKKREKDRSPFERDSWGRW